MESIFLGISNYEMFVSKKQFHQCLKALKNVQETSLNYKWLKSSSLVNNKLELDLSTKQLDKIKTEKTSEDEMWFPRDLSQM